MGDGSAIWTSIGESNCVRARGSGRRTRLFGGVLDSIVGGGESRERLLRSVIDGKSVSALVLTEECWRSSDGGNAIFFATCCNETRRYTSISACFWTSSWNIACSFCFSISTCLSISSLAFTSHSLLTIDSKAALILSFSLCVFKAFTSASCAFNFICSSFAFNILPNSTTSLSFLISRTTGRLRRLAVSGRFNGLTFKQLLMTFCNSCE